MGKLGNEQNVLNPSRCTLLKKFETKLFRLAYAMLIFVPQNRLPLQENLHWDVHIPPKRQEGLTYLKASVESIALCF